MALDIKIILTIIIAVVFCGIAVSKSDPIKTDKNAAIINLPFVRISAELDLSDSRPKEIPVIKIIIKSTNT